MSEHLSPVWGPITQRQTRTKPVACPRFIKELEAEKEEEEASGGFGLRKNRTESSLSLGPQGNPGL